jgi:hypothetical protein
VNLKTSRRAAALATGLAVVAGSTLLIAGPASAAEIQVTADQIQGSIEPGAYAGWHEGYATPGAPAVLSDAGLTMSGPSQIIYGLNEDGGVAIDGTTVTFASLVATADFSSTSDALVYQIPVFIDGVDSAFSTLRPVNAGAAGIDGLWQASNGNVPGIAANTPVTVDEISAALGGFQLLAFGVVAIEGQTDVLQSVTFDGDTYNFAAPVVAPVFDPLVVVDPDTIYFSDVRPGGAGFAVTVTGFTPGDTLTISVIDPNGEVFGSADGGDTVIADADGGFAVADLTFVGEGIQVGTYTFRVTDSAGVFAEDAIAVVADPVAAGAPVVPTLADTGSDSGVLVGGAAALLLLGAAGMLFAAGRRKGAQVTA